MQLINFGSQCVVVAIDAKKEQTAADGMFIKTEAVLILGLMQVEWAAKAVRMGAGEILLTSMEL